MNTTSKNQSNECKTMTCQTFMKIRGTDKVYQEALEAAAKFNRRLFHDRKTRIPFIDSQTRVAQSNSLLWYLKCQREEGSKPEQVYSYPVRSWVKKRRLQYDTDLSLIRMPSYDLQQINENSNSTDSIQPLYKYSSIMEQEEPVSRPLMDDWHMHMQDDSFDYYNDNDNDNESDFDDYEDSKRKKHKRAKGTKKKVELNPDDKPFVCDKCGVKYKTKPGLTYHIHKMHGNNNNNNNNNTSASSNHASTSNNNAHGSSNAHGNSNAHASAVGSIADTHTHVESHHRGSNTKVSECIIADENTNSVFDSAYDDSNHNAPTTAGSTSSHQQANAAKAGISSISSSSSTSIINPKLCSTCGFASIDQDPKRQAENLVGCCECTRSFHPVCLSFTANMILSVQKYNWQCIECKKCTICGNSENDDKLLFCDDCDRGYHMYCLTPALNDAPDGDWRCELCVQQFGPQ